MIAAETLSRRPAPGQEVHRRPDLGPPIARPRSRDATRPRGCPRPMAQRRDRVLGFYVSPGATFADQLRGPA
eukprot:7896388-Pyramimonas_sp.AAC.1